MPFSVGDVVRGVELVALEFQVQLKSVVGPRTEFETAHLIVERKPRDVDGTR